MEQPSLLPRMITSISGDFAQIAQRALQFWKNPAFVSATAPHAEQITPLVIAACYRVKPHWNATVNKLSATVLSELEKQNQELFERVCNDRYSTGACRLTAAAAEASSAGAVGTDAMDASLGDEGDEGVESDPPTSLRRASYQNAVGKEQALPTFGGRGKWASGNGQPPVTITGVAPWAQPTSNRISPSKARRTLGHASDDVIGEDDEDVTMTGGDHAGGPDQMVTESFEEEKGPMSLTDGTQAPMDDGEPDAGPVPGSELESGYARVMAFVQEFRAAEAREAAARNTMSLTPTLLPDLKFHELVSSVPRCLLSPTRHISFASRIV